MTDAIMNTLATVAYLGAGILFILSLGGLSTQESARRGNVYGMLGMVLASRWRKSFHFADRTQSRKDPFLAASLVC